MIKKNNKRKKQLGIFLVIVVVSIVILYLNLSWYGKAKVYEFLFRDAYPIQTVAKSYYFSKRDDFNVFSEWYKNHPKVKKLRFAMIPDKEKYCAEVNRLDECADVPELEDIIMPFNFRASSGGIVFYLGVEVVEGTRYDVAIVNTENSQREQIACQDISLNQKRGMCGITLEENWIIDYEWFPNPKINLKSINDE